MKPEEILKKYRKIMKVLAIPFIPLIIYIGLYLPAKGKLNLLNSEYKKYATILTDAGIAYNTPGQNPPAETSSIAKRLSQSEEMLSQSETEAINTISRLCYKLNIDLISITPLKKEVAIDAGNNAIVVGERKVSKTTIKLSLTTNFNNLIKFIEETKKLKNIIVVNRISVAKTDVMATTSDRLRVELELSTYNLSIINL